MSIPFAKTALDASKRQMKRHKAAKSRRACSALNAFGEPCRSPTVGPGGLCAAHSGTLDMRELGRAGGRRSGEIRRAARRSLAAVFVELLEREADAAIQATRDALSRGEVDRAVPILKAIASDHHAPVEVKRQERIRERDAVSEAERQRLAAEDFEYRQRNMWAIARGELPPHLER
jgi:hypothetical protein